MYVESYPLKNFVVNITPINRMHFGRLRFFDNRNRVKMDDSPLSFEFAITAREKDLHNWHIHLKDQAGNLIECELEEQETPSVDVTHFPILDKAHKSFYST